MNPEDRQFDPKNSIGAQPWYVIMWYLICIHTSYWLGGKWYRDWKVTRAERKRKEQQ